MISTSGITIEIPVLLYQRLQRLAETTHRSVQEILTTTINVALPYDPNLPTKIADEMAAMALFPDQALWAATASSFAPGQERLLQQLTESGKERQLTDAETAELQQLLGAYDYAVLRRANALAILAQRGYTLPNRTEMTGVYGDEPENP